MGVTQSCASGRPFRPGPARPGLGCLFCLFLEAAALMDSVGDAESMGFVLGGSALSPFHRDRWGSSDLLSSPRGQHQPSLCLPELLSLVVRVGCGNVWWWQGSGLACLPLLYWLPSLLSIHFRPTLGPLPNHWLIHSSDRSFSVCSSNWSLRFPPVLIRKDSDSSISVLE